MKNVELSQWAKYDNLELGPRSETTSDETLHADHFVCVNTEEIWLQEFL